MDQPSVSPSGRPATPEKLNLLGWIARLTHRDLSDKGGAKMLAAVAAVPELSPDAALLALLPGVRDTLARACGDAFARHLKTELLDYPPSMQASAKADWQHLVRSLDAANLLIASGWARERLFAFAKSRNADALTHTRWVVEGWQKAGRIAPALCPECGDVLIDLPAERPEPDTNYGGCSAGHGCNRCETDTRVYHAPNSRGPDAAFLG